MDIKNKVKVEKPYYANEIGMVVEVKEVGKYEIKTGLQHGGVRFLTMEKVND